MRFALVSHTTSNLGDDIQSVAARGFLPCVDEFVDRDRIGQFAPAQPTAMILNGWWMHKSRNWPPSAQIRPLLLSMHVFRRANVLIRGIGRDYFLRHGPTGCRDLDTMRRMRRAGVPAYFSGCLTLTLQRPTVQRSDEVLFVDPFGPVQRRWPEPADSSFRKDLMDRFPSDWKRRSRFFTHQIDPNLHVDKRHDLAVERLTDYAGASLVVTSRLHCALPCVAFDTPVLFCRCGFQEERLTGLADLFHCMMVADLATGSKSLDVDSFTDPPGTKKAKMLADRLAAGCSDFVRSMSA